MVCINLMREVSLPRGAKPIRPVGRERRDCDSRRELRALVVRRENSSTGRVFYTAPTSSPTTLIKQKQPEINSSCFVWCGRRDLNPYVGNTRPSNVRVCRFRHSRVASSIIQHYSTLVKVFFKKSYTLKIIFYIMSICTPYTCVIIRLQVKKNLFYYTFQGGF